MNFLSEKPTFETSGYLTPEEEKGLNTHKSTIVTEEEELENDETRNNRLVDQHAD